MAIPKKKKKSLLKTKTDNEEVKQLAANIRNDFHGLREMAEDYFQGYVRDGMSPKAAYKKMEEKMKTITNDDIMRFVADYGPDA